MVMCAPTGFLHRQTMTTTLHSSAPAAQCMFYSTCPHCPMRYKMTLAPPQLPDGSLETPFLLGGAPFHAHFKKCSYRPPPPPPWQSSVTMQGPSQIFPDNSTLLRVGTLRPSPRDLRSCSGHDAPLRKTPSPPAHHHQHII